MLNTQEMRMRFYPEKDSLQWLPFPKRRNATDHHALHIYKEKQLVRKTIEVIEN